ncbi:hypothetical protein AB1Y20_003128 [Prymnesium parvum]|uniref:Mei2-like C-terminal RNA recognition motif domain-containing protein n=1 Tax=Prymnesium parvum TaxID=97485 RepID=A0AB34JDE9_PRYPA
MRALDDISSPSKRTTWSSQSRTQPPDAQRSSATQSQHVPSLQTPTDRDLLEIEQLFAPASVTAPHPRFSEDKHFLSQEVLLRSELPGLPQLQHLPPPQPQHLMAGCGQSDLGLHQRSADRVDAQLHERGQQQQQQLREHFQQQQLIHHHLNQQNWPSQANQPNLDLQLQQMMINYASPQWMSFAAQFNALSRTALIQQQAESLISQKMRECMQQPMLSPSIPLQYVQTARTETRPPSTSSSGTISPSSCYEPNPPPRLSRLHGGASGAASPWRSDRNRASLCDVSFVSPRRCHASSHGSNSGSSSRSSKKDARRDLESGKGKEPRAISQETHDLFKIDEAKMRFGDDKRTTLMIRNIPNKCTLSSLMSTFSEVFKGERGLFDFFYLPMDVKSKCNVGYAFINIREQSKVQVFYHKLQGKMWDRFNPDKCCQITYGRIQGFDALLKTFAESSVVRECRSSGEMGAEHVQVIVHTRDAKEKGCASEKILILAADCLSKILRKQLGCNDGDFSQQADFMRSTTYIDAAQASERFEPW